ncbi:hypothetical protein GCM10025857_01110 [Alicyclobacillus contaminans]|nr:hypothetical protein GCM10025857_01110 [Alicyclobacillus contaminans]
MNHWLTFGMSNYQTSGFSDTSRHMTHAFAGRRHYVEPPKPITAWKRLDGHVVRWDYESIEDVNRLIPPLPIPSRLDKFGVGAALQAKQLDRVLSTIIGTAWRENTVAYVTNWTPQFQPLIEKLAPKFLVFDIVDDVLSFPYRMNKERTEAAWSKLAAQANLVVAVSETLQQDAIRRWQRPVQVLSNAVDADHFSTPSRNVPKGFSIHRCRASDSPAPSTTGWTMN